MTRRPTLPLASLALLLALLVVASPSVHAQGDTTDFYNFDDREVDILSQRYQALGGGYQGFLAFNDYAGVNQIASSLGLDDISGPMILNGGGGFVSVLIVPNLRLGAYGAGATKRTEKTTDSLVQSLRYARSVFGLHIDYAIRLSSNLTVVPGVIAGTNNLTLESTRSNASGISSNVLVPATAGSFHNARLERTDLWVLPVVNLEWAPFRLAMIRVGAGYSASAIEGDWVDPNGVVVADMPEISTNGVVVSAGVFIGLFQLQ